MPQYPDTLSLHEFVTSSLSFSLAPHPLCKFNSLSLSTLLFQILLQLFIVLLLLSFRHNFFLIMMILCDELQPSKMKVSPSILRIILSDKESKLPSSIIWLQATPQEPKEGDVMAYAANDLYNVSESFKEEIRREQSRITLIRVH